MAKEQKFNVTLLGALGSIGQHLSLYLTTHPHIKRLNLYSTSSAVKGVEEELSQINTDIEIKAFEGSTNEAAAAFELGQALKFLDGDQTVEADIIVICSGVSRKAEDMNREQLFSSNAEILLRYSKVIAEVCPQKSMICIVTNPVNSIIPLVAKVIQSNPKAQGIDKRLFGITTLDIERANKFYTELLRKKSGIVQNIADISVPVIGGHSALTILPLFSQATVRCDIKDEEREKLIDKLAHAGDEVIRKKRSSATISMAYATKKFLDSLMLALRGETNIYAYAYVKLESQAMNKHLNNETKRIVGDCAYFAMQVHLSIDGIAAIKDLPTESSWTEIERRRLESVKSSLKEDIAKGETFADLALSL